MFLFILETATEIWQTRCRWLTPSPAPPKNRKPPTNHFTALFLFQKFDKQEVVDWSTSSLVPPKKREPPTNHFTASFLSHKFDKQEIVDWRQVLPRPRKPRKPPANHFISIVVFISWHDRCNMKFNSTVIVWGSNRISWNDNLGRLFEPQHSTMFLFVLETVEQTIRNLFNILPKWGKAPNQSFDSGVFISYERYLHY